MAHDLRGDEANSADVLVTILAREAEAAREMRAHDVTVEHGHGAPGRLQERHQSVRGRRLAGAGQPGEPEADAAQGTGDHEAATALLADTAAAAPRAGRLNHTSPRSRPSISDSRATSGMNSSSSRSRVSGRSAPFWIGLRWNHECLNE